MFGIRKIAALTMLIGGLTFGATTLISPTIATACPNCKDALESNDPRLNNVAKGYFYSILFMLGTPPTIMAGFGIAVYRAYKRAAKERDTEGQSVADGVGMEASTTA
ncbi:MAG: hypothetical protein QM811_10090 [Pirellulales bacterium]